MYTGSVPFVADAVADLDSMILHAELPHAPMAAAPVQLSSLIRRLLEKDPSKREGWSGLFCFPC